jgi:hypothetical protein
LFLGLVLQAIGAAFLALFTFLILIFFFLAHNSKYLS